MAAAGAVSGTLDPEQVAHVLCERAAALLHVPGVAVLAVHNKQVHVLHAQGVSTNFVDGETGPLENSIVGRAVTENRTFAAWDVRQSADDRLARAAESEGIVSVACAPMFFGGKAIGALNVYCRDARCFTEDQFHVLSLLATHGAVAITNARAYKELREKAAEVRAGFVRVGEALSASLDIGETLRVIVQLATEMIDASGGAVFLLRDAAEGGGMRLAGMRGMERRAVRRFRLMPVSPIEQQALDSREIQIVDDTRQHKDVAFPLLRLSVTKTADTRSLACVPLYIKNQPTGVLELYGTEPNGFNRNEVQLLASFAHQATIAIENARLFAQERTVAQTLQQAFSPELPDNISGFEIGRIYEPGSEIARVGGDLYDLFTLPDGRIAGVIADVSGQGTYAATVAVMAKYTIRAFALEDANPSSVLRRVNEALRHQIGDSVFLTIIYALINPFDRSVALACGAHPSALLCRNGAKQSVEVDAKPGMMVGAFAHQEYETSQLSLSAGDVLVFFTDGVTEANREGSEKRNTKTMFGTERLGRIIAQNAHLPAQEVAAAIYSAVTDYSNGQRLDDIALLVLKANG